MSGIEGHIFGPMAQTYAYAIAGGLIATFTVTPALCGLLLRGQDARRPRRCWCACCTASYQPVLRFALANRILTLGAHGAAAAGRRRSAVRTLGLEFLPKLEEGNMWIRATMPTSISLEDRQRLRQPHARDHADPIPRW